jgi:cellulose synthase/poly-beta-1,6-N-acetylglucosamine synthase-like glycosyltransferase
VLHISYILITSLCTLLFAYYGYVVVLAFLGLKNAKKQQPNYAFQPSVSIVVPFRDEGENIKLLLKDVAKQFYPNNLYELVLVNDHSSPANMHLVKEYVQRTSVRNIMLLKNPGRGKKEALAYGMSKAHAPLILQTDADCRLPEHWISEMVQDFMDVETELVLGPVGMVPGNTFWSRFAALDFLSLQASGLGLALNNRPFMGSAANMAYRKTTWLKHADKHIREQSGDDTFLIQSLAAERKLAIRTSGLSAALVKTEAPVTLWEFIQQRLRWGGKTKHYKSTLAKLIALDVFFLNLLFLLMLGLSFWDGSFLPFALSFFLTKVYVDMTLLMRFAHLSEQRSLLRPFLAVSLLYAFYIVGTSLLILLAPGMAKWKGDPVRKPAKAQS